MTVYSKINPDSIRPKDYKDLGPVPEQARHYLNNRGIYNELRTAYLYGHINKQQLLTLRGQVRAGDADGAYKGLGRILMRGE
jgi:hypothetical protein